MNKRILLDLDGVLADFVGAAARLHKPADPTVASWNFIEQWGLTQSDFWTHMGYDFWLNVPLAPDAFKVLALCEEVMGAKNICLLTAPCDTKGCLDGKRDWIRKHFPEYKRRFLIGSPKHFVATPYSLLVDDSDRNCEEFEEANGTACLFPQPWNKARDKAHLALEVLKQSLKEFIKV